MGKSVLTILLGFIVIFSTVSNNINQASLETEINLYESYDKLNAKNIAEGGAHFILTRLINNTLWRGTRSNVSLADGVFTASAVTDTSLGPGGIYVSSYSNFSGVEDSVFVLLTIMSSFPINVRAGVTSNTTVEISGTIEIDGRNHDSDGNVIPSSGTFGISTTSAFNQQGNGRVGGTADSIDYVPTDPADPAVVETGATWPDGFPDTPDKVMGGTDAGFPEGTLKMIAQSGYNGSQYVTDPALLNYPLSGVTYVEMGWAQTWLSIDFGQSSGILVVHNSSTNSVIKNLNAGTFKGIIIADDVDKVHCDIIGAIVVLTSSPPAGNVIGNGSGSIKYSSEVLTDNSSGLPGVKGNLQYIGWIY